MTLPGLLFTLTYGWLRRIFRKKRKVVALNYTTTMSSPYFSTGMSNVTTTASLNNASFTYRTKPNQ